MIRKGFELTEEDVDYVHSHIDALVGRVAAKWVGKPLGPLEPMVFEEYNGEAIKSTYRDVVLLLLRRLGRDVGLRIECNKLGPDLSPRLERLETSGYHEDVATEVLFDSHVVLCAVLDMVGGAISDI